MYWRGYKRLNCQGLLTIPKVYLRQILDVRRKWIGSVIIALLLRFKILVIYFIVVIS